MSQELAPEWLEEAASSVATAETMLCALHEHVADDPIEWISPLIHPDAEMRLLIT